MVRQFLSIASLKTASRCWVPAAKPATYRSFSSRQRCVLFNTVEQDGVNLIANDDVLSSEEIVRHTETFEPTVHSSEEVFTAGPVNRA